MDLIVVESPKKSRHIQHMLGSDYIIIPTLGHIKNLPPKELAVDVQNGFLPQYQIDRGKGEIIKRIKDTGERADRIILATDPDREGEGIAYHIWSSLPQKLQRKCVRAEFHAITPDGINNGLRACRTLDFNVAMAQQARRVLDRLTGYLVSPLLWAQVKGQVGLSAGRVQSTALKLIYDREMAIRAFVVEEYWTVKGRFGREPDMNFYGDLAEINGAQLSKAPIPGREEVDQVLEHLRRSNFVIENIERRKVAYGPPAPFITPSLLKAAASQLGFSSKKTMQIAQELFEGIGGTAGTDGLITYMRTDSPRVDPTAQREAKSYIEQRWGQRYVNDNQSFSAKEGAQDAHECIRPTKVSRNPEQLKQVLNGDQLALYALIHQRFIVSQMADALHEEVHVDVAGDDRGYTTLFKAFSSKILFDGWRVTSSEVFNKWQPSLDHLLPEEAVIGQEFLPEKHNTRPPAHYSESSLIEALERLGVGRPSTYVSIIDTLIDKQYIKRTKLNLVIEQLGEIVVQALKVCFPQVLDAEFTAIMESELDRIAAGECDWTEPLSDLYSEIIRAQKKLESQKNMSNRFGGKQQRKTVKPASKTRGENRR